MPHRRWLRLSVHPATNEDSPRMDRAAGDTTDLLRDVAEYVACAGAIGRLLLRHGKFSVILDSNGRVPGLVGVYTQARGRKYFKGPQRPRLADLTDTELVV